VRIYEYCERPLHGKVALMDDEWATVGSSNLDPLSLALNLEANVIIRDRAFNQELFERLDLMIRHSCKAIEVEQLEPLRGWQLVRSYLVYHITRRYPGWASWLPRHVPRLRHAYSNQGAKE
jgi:cardiolipin synthase A/B